MKQQAVEQLNSQIDFLNNFNFDIWSCLNSQERKGLLQQLENAMAKEQNRTPRTITERIYEGGTFGSYKDSKPDLLYINKDLLDNPSRGYALMDTVIHEGRHAYQDDVVKGRIPVTGISPLVIEDWKQQFGKGKVYNGRVFGRIPYRFQPIEIDAHDYAFNKMQSFVGQLGNDPLYQIYMRKGQILRKDNTTEAKKKYGNDFEKKIADNLTHRYQRNQGIRNQILLMPDPLPELTEIDSVIKEANYTGPSDNINTNIFLKERALPPESQNQGKETPISDQGTKTLPQVQDSEMPSQNQNTDALSQGKGVENPSPAQEPKSSSQNQGKRSFDTRPRNERLASRSRHRSFFSRADSRYFIIRNWFSRL